MYEFLHAIIKQMNIARTDIYFSKYNDSRKQDNRNPDRRLFNRTYGCKHNICIYIHRIKPMFLIKIYLYTVFVLHSI